MAFDIKKWVQDEEDATSSHDLEKLFTLYSDDCFYEDLAIDQVCNGKEEIRAFLTGAFSVFPDFKVETVSYFFADEQLCTEVIISGTHKGNAPHLPPANNKSFSVRGAHICKLRDGKAVRITDYYDSASLMRQLGHIPDSAKA